VFKEREELGNKLSEKGNLEELSIERKEHPRMKKKGGVANRPPLRKGQFLELGINGGVRGEIYPSNPRLPREGKEGKEISKGRAKKEETM